MTSQPFHYLKVVAAATAAALLYLIPWPVPILGDVLKLICIAILFVVMTCLLRIESWTLSFGVAIIFCLIDAAQCYLSLKVPKADIAQANTDTPRLLLGAVLVLASPINLFAPVIAAGATHAIIRRQRSLSA